jgi:SpoVK/Ycf46/Vps4 family AAA+-type ATPase
MKMIRITFLSDLKFQFYKETWFKVYHVIFVGPPGTGKTLRAKAVAGEAQVPFFSIGRRIGQSCFEIKSHRWRF